jgi:hypothetical protein
MSKKGFVFVEEAVGTWFEHDDGWKVSLRICSLDELKRIRKQTVKEKFTFKRLDGAPYRVKWDETDEEAQSSMIWDYCIVDWQEMYDKDGETPLALTAENKMMLMNKSAKFAKFVTDSMTKLNELQEQGKEESEKN